MDLSANVTGFSPCSQIRAAKALVRKVLEIELLSRHCWPTEFTPLASCHSRHNEAYPDFVITPNIQDVSSQHEQGGVVLCRRSVANRITIGDATTKGKPMRT
jgi:hypothetical protein